MTPAQLYADSLLRSRCSKQDGYCLEYDASTRNCLLQSPPNWRSWASRKDLNALVSSPVRPSVYLRLLFLDFFCLCGNYLDERLQSIAEPANTWR